MGLQARPRHAAELVADCFELAADVRELDMRASPYDLADARLPAGAASRPPAGRAEYARAQAGFARRAAPLRDAADRPLRRPARPERPLVVARSLSSID